MTNRSMLIWLGVALLLGIGAVVALRSGGGSAGGGGRSQAVAAGDRLADFAPSEVRAVRVAGSAGGGDVLVRDDRTGGWALLLGGEESRRWPLATGNVQSALRLLAEARSLGAPEGASAPREGDAPTPARTDVRVTLDGGREVVFRIGERPLAGRVLVEVEEVGDGRGAAGRTRTAMADERLARMFANPGPRGWRETALVPGMGPDVSRLSLSNAERTLSLGRAAGRWQLREPVAGPANTEAVGAMITALSTTRIVDFFDGRVPDPGVTGLGSPVATITVETDRRVTAAEGTPGDVRVETDRTVVLLGGPADTASGTNIYASVRTGEGPARVVAIDATSLARVPYDPAEYLAKTSSRAAAADVHAVTMLRGGAEDGESAGGAGGAGIDRRLRRTLDGWAEVGPDGADALLARPESAAVDELLNLLASRPANATLVREPAGFWPVGTITLAGRDGGALDYLTVGRGEEETIVVRNGDVFRTYAGAGAPRPLREFVQGVRSGRGETGGGGGERDARNADLVK